MIAINYKNFNNEIQGALIYYNTNICLLTLEFFILFYKEVRSHLYKTDLYKNYFLSQNQLFSYRYSSKTFRDSTVALLFACGKF